MRADPGGDPSASAGQEATSYLLPFKGAALIRLQGLTGTTAPEPALEQGSHGELQFLIPRGAAIPDPMESCNP